MLRQQWSVAMTRPGRVRFPSSTRSRQARATQQPKLHGPGEPSPGPVGFSHCCIAGI